MTKVTMTYGPGKGILQRALKELDAREVKVGWFKSARYPDGTFVAYIAAIMEFGYAPKGIPPRLGLRELIEAKQGEWSQVAERLAKATFNGASAGDMLDVLGGKVAGDIQKRISDVVEPPLAESTLKNRASRMHIPVADLSGTGAKPLVEPVMKGGGSGGLLLASVQWLVTMTGQGE
jgi:hypothetical protein